MFDNWTIGKKLGWAFALAVSLAALIAGVAINTLQSSLDSSERLAASGRRLVASNEFDGITQRVIGDGRAYILTKDDRYAQEVSRHRKEADELLAKMRAEIDTTEARGLLDEVAREAAAHNAALDRVLELRRGGAGLEAIDKTKLDELDRAFDRLEQRVEAFDAYEHQALAREQEQAQKNAANARTFLMGVAAAALLAGIAVSLLLTRGLTRDIGSAVQHMQSASAELQTSSAQQATGSKEQASAASEVSTTLKELAATARQIGESAQRVAQLAEEARVAAKGGDQIGGRAQDAVATTKRQVDLIVNHMLDLGRKSQQIGGVLDIINELSEQTNILSINATIEAAGAGEAGARFSAVAEEIRKLADRTAGSTKEIRTLVEEIRSGVNTTVMATESGSKAADAGARQITEVAAAFAKIAETVVVTTQAAKEIELSTKQQTTAVDQVNLAIAGVAQAAKDSEASTAQTVQAASQLARLAGDLTRLIRAESPR